jgi:integrase
LVQINDSENLRRKLPARANRQIHLGGSTLDHRAHICAFFNSRDEEYRVLLPFLEEGLKSQEKNVHTVDPRLRDDHHQRLTSAGVDVEAVSESGQFELRDWSDTHLAGGHFDQHRTLALFKQMIDKSTLDGFPLTRFVTNMEWALEANLDTNALLEYEAMANNVWLRHATVRRYCLLIATKVIPRLSAGALMEVTEDAWEDALQEILDEDAFYNVRKYAKQPSSNAQTHSRPLVKALRHWFQFLSQIGVHPDVGNQNLLDNQKNDTSDADPGNSDQASKVPGAGLIDLAKRLPVLGLVKVDASLITVDEYLEVLQRLVGSKNFADSNDRSAARVALILGYRCGLRRAEVEWLRVSDFDRVNYLHVRPTEMRALKTSNSRRDLPLELLVPAEELAHVRRRISQVRALALEKKIPLQGALLFSEAGDPARLMDFNAKVLGMIRWAFQADERRDWAPIDPSFRFHRLRHSCATVTFLRLWPELHAIAQHIFGKKAKAILQWVIEDSKHFRERLMGSSVTEVDLQAIALLLGHGSAATSLEHYVHVLDWYERLITWNKPPPNSGGMVGSQHLLKTPDLAGNVVRRFGKRSRTSAQLHARLLSSL